LESAAIRRRLVAKRRHVQVRHRRWHLRSEDGATAQTLSASANTTGSQFRKVLVSIKRDGTYVVTYGAVAATQAAALKPAEPVDSVEVGYLEIPVSFTGGTTAITAGMCKQAALIADSVGQAGALP
jgi:hypothetical protein